MVDDKNIIFTCPKCNQNFSLNELLNHDTIAFNSYVDAKVKGELDLALDKERTSLKNQNNLETNQKLQAQKEEFTAQKEKILENHRQSLKQAETELLAAQNQLKILEGNQEALLGQKIAETKTQFGDKIKELELTIKDKTAMIDNQRQEMVDKINDLKSTDEIEYLNQKNEIIQEHNLIIAQMQKDLSEAQNQLKLFETTKQLEVENKIKEAKAQVAQEITDLKLSIQAKEAEMNQEINNVLHQKENEYRDLQAKLEAQHQAEILELKSALDRNKVFASKIKGENFEQEFARELQKSFGSTDVIEKITVGETKADYLQIVKKNNLEIGKIVYEVKNAKWSDAWLPKFETDIAKQRAKYGILVATSLNEKYHGISFIKSPEHENIWVSDPDSFIFVAQVIRKLIEMENAFLIKEKELSSNETDERNKEYQKIIQLKEYINFGLPEFLKSFKIQLTNLEKIQNSMQKNTNNLEKTRLHLRKKFDKLVKNKLEEIVGQVIVENQTIDYIEEKMDDVLPVSEETSSYQN